MSLTLTRQQKFALLRGAVFKLPGSKVRNFSRVYSLLEQIEIHTGEKGCRVRINLLAEKLHCSRATVMRTTKLAEELGVLNVGRDRDEENIYRRTGGNGPNYYKIFWDRVAKFCSAETRELAQMDRPAKQPTETEQKRREVPPVRASVAGVEWNRVREELRDFGIASPATAVDRAYLAGLSPEDCLALLAYAANRPPGYWNEPAAVLFHRLGNARPGAAPDQDWPKPSSKFELAQKRERDRLRQQATEEQEQAAAQKNREQDAIRAVSEAEFGPLLDSLSKEERDRLAKQKFGDGPTWKIYQREGIRSRLVRGSLIHALRKEKQSC